ncbi:hypothetical protein MMAG44476_37328 [Mycolicibacterium mageritense DSM 44476 = CIP 104973]|uniref:HNH endonuclease n=1 Tax=Mycolicibacterium mageritense TaxID=53462 RepID=A0ABM7I3T2_MYCME|nr:MULTISPECIES: hypothetical protein [Mycolicibacterium]MCC9185450.1 hypothetical protein [Mycolicibacterium mageritense]MCV7210791.1 hypothetical protein [Mycolicibacterium canariasense]ORV18630.1 hypothetical protein AWB94_33485 [Mycolicibacterium canariasense]CDO25781.1 hypothetical protein BN978_06327 [Mycolicibacterium mageritense DSM 44476 = CIP 104973]BBX37553.1 hypothetical protein MMAGJ_68350 [Mycolicibacterium mageritense]
MRTAAGLVVDPRVHAEEIARFTGYIVEGPADHDCDIWIGGIGADGYGRFHINRGGARFCVRPNRYALALFGGGAVAPRILALHECDNPICTRVGPHHIVGGDQRHNMARMVAMRRGGSGRVIRGALRDLRRQRSVALREAVRCGWDACAVEAALLGNQPTLW